MRLMRRNVMIYLLCVLVVFVVYSSMSSLPRLKEIFGILSSNNKTELSAGKPEMMPEESVRERQQKNNAENVEWWKSLNKEPIQEELYKRQHPQDCSQAKILLYNYIFAESAGHGSQIHYLSLALSYAFEAGRVLVLNTKSSWMLSPSINAPPDQTQDQNLPCGTKCNDFFTGYFFPISNCTIENIGVKWTETGPNIEFLKPYMFDFRDQLEEERVLYWSDRNVWVDFQKHWREYVPQTLKWGDGTLLWWRSQLIYYILRPLPTTWEIIDNEKRTLGFLARNTASKDEKRGPVYPIAGLHIRHGESTILSGEKRIQLNPEVYLLALTDLSNKHQLRGTPTNIFLSTEHEEEIHTIKSNFSQYSFYHINEVVTDAHSLLILGKPLPLTTLHLIAVKNLFLQIACDFFVGTFKSNYSRMILELLTAIGRRIPMASVDLSNWIVNP